MVKKIIHISGMHCISCEIILDKELKKLSGVKLLMLSHKKGIMEIEYKEEKYYNRVVEKIEKSGFNIVEKKKIRGIVSSLGQERILWRKNKISLEVILNNIALFLGIIVFFYLFSLIDIYSFLPEMNSINYLSAFLVGIVASLSTCLAITGGIIIGFSRYFEEESGISGHFKTQVLFQIGRIGGFFVLGGILGYIGNIFNFGYSISGILTFIVGFILLYLGLNIIGLLPNITKFGFHLPKSMALKIEKVKNPKYAIIIGALTFFLPCGFTQSIQLLAINSGSFIQGGLVMLLFAIGTTPVLFSVGLGSSYFKGKNFPVLNKIIGTLVILFGIITISNSYNLINFSSIVNSNNEIVNSDINIENLDVEIINVKHNGWSTEPNIINLKKGGNYKIIVTPTKNGIGCMSTQTIPKLNTKVSYVTAGEPIIYDIINAKTGTYDIVCSAMGMEQGKIIVN